LSGRAVRRTVVWAVLAAAFAVTACDGVFNIRGQLTTPSGTPIPNVEVSAYDGATRATTDARGCFDLMKVCSPRAHPVEVSTTIDGRRVGLATLTAPTQKLIRFAIAIQDDKAAVSATPLADLGPCR